MLVKGEGQNAEQVEYVVMSELVPEEHLLKKISRVLDFGFVYDLVEDKYSKDKGRPGIDPVVLVKMVLLQFLFGIRSMRQTCKEIEVNAAYRWFLGMGWQDKAPHFSTYGKNYSRRFEGTDLFEKIFAHILEQCYKAGYIKGEEVFVDSTHIKASANRNKKLKQKVRHEAHVYARDLRMEINEDRWALGKEAYDDDDPNDSEGAEAAQSKTDPNGGEEVEVTRSKTDPEAGMFVKGEHRRDFAYMAQTACNRHGFVLGYEVVQGNVHDSKSFWKLYENIRDIAPDYLIADAAYKTPAILRKLFHDDVVPVMPYTRPKTGKDLFSRSDFHYDRETNCYSCPGGQTLRHTTTNREGRRIYRSRAKLCKSCPHLAHCTNSKNHVKIIERHIWQDYVEQAEQIRKTPDGKALYKQRKQTIERVFADAKEKHGLRYTQYRGLAKVKMQVSLTFACLNLKKLATWAAKLPPKPSPTHRYVSFWRILSFILPFPAQNPIPACR